MKLVKLLTVSLCTFLLAASALAQGSLTPPGAPAPSMKTLDQVEPRTPISSLPYTITNSGSYYVTANLTSTNHGVIITANDVTLDLMGFTLSGDGDTLEHGVYLAGATNSTIQNVVVHNGVVRNFWDGIHAEHTMDSRFEHLIIASNGSYGVKFSAFFGKGNGNTIAECTISGNGSDGIFLSGYGAECNGNTITGCTISGNGSRGFLINGNYGRCNGNTIVDCSISGNLSWGMQLTGDPGHCEGNTIADCMIRENGERGITLYYVTGSRIEGNHITGQTGTTTYGIKCDNTEGNLIVRNMCEGQTDNFVMDPDDTYGPIVTTSGPLSETNPWANFSR